MKLTALRPRRRPPDPLRLETTIAVAMTLPQTLMATLAARQAVVDQGLNIERFICGHLVGVSRRNIASAGPFDRGPAIIFWPAISLAIFRIEDPQPLMGKRTTGPYPLRLKDLRRHRLIALRRRQFSLAVQTDRRQGPPPEADATSAKGPLQEVPFLRVLVLVTRSNIEMVAATKLLKLAKTVVMLIGHTAVT